MVSNRQARPTGELMQAPPITPPNGGAWVCLNRPENDPRQRPPYPFNKFGLLLIELYTYLRITPRRGLFFSQAALLIAICRCFCRKSGDVKTHDKLNKHNTLHQFIVQKVAIISAMLLPIWFSTCKFTCSFNIQLAS